MIKLKKHSEKRISRGHLWVFSNEIASPEISQLDKGEVHELFDFSDNFLGMAYANPNSLISARIVSRDRTQIDYSFVRIRIHEANQRRLNICQGSDSYRLFYGDSDLLPGLIIDKYGDVYVIQSSTAGVDLLMDMIVQAIIDLFSPESIYIRNDLPVRDLEGIPRDKRLVHGYLPEPTTISLNGLKFAVDVANGQKTGFFLDQEFNRASLMKYLVPNSRVLDLFCYSGAWAINSAARKSCSVTAIDSSASALELAR
ncbi:MAG: class I SAM-dependent rRNA methyltransferase, partial [Desulfomonilaceae bacterium]